MLELAKLHTRNYTQININQDHALADNPYVNTEL